MDQPPSAPHEPGVEPPRDAPPPDPRPAVAETPPPATTPPAAEDSPYAQPRIGAADDGQHTSLPGQVERAGAVYVPAGLWARIAAFLIDGAFLLIMHQIMLAIIGFEGPSVDQLMDLLNAALSEMMSGGTPSAGLLADYQELMRPMYIAGWLNVLMCGAYFTVFHGLGGATLGKLALGIRVLRRDGSPLGVGWALLRYLGYLIVARLAYTAWLIPFNAEQRTLYDMVLGTNVFRPQRRT